MVNFIWCLDLSLKMKLAYFSPLSPQRSGISDYSEELLPYLAEGSEIALFVDGFQPANRELRILAAAVPVGIDR